MRLRPLPRQSLRHRGFSLVELMVGIVLAMVAVIVVMQIFRLSESRNRTTAGTSSVAMDGAVALTDLQRMTRQAGEGIVGADLLGCDLTLINGFRLSALAPVTINSADVADGDTGTDTLLIMTGNGVGSPEGDRVTGVVGATLNVLTPNAFAQNDMVVPAAEAACGLKLATVNSVAGVSPNGSINIAPAAAATVSAVYNLGRAPRFVAFRVKGGQLMQCDYTLKNCKDDNVANWTVLYDGVVGLRAEYGDIIATPTSYSKTTPTTPDEWRKMGMLRFALVLRSGQLEKDVVTTNQNLTWAGGNIDLSGLPSWDHYRYRVYEAVVPLRNVVNTK